MQRLCLAWNHSVTFASLKGICTSGSFALTRSLPADLGLDFDKEHLQPACDQYFRPGCQCQNEADAGMGKVGAGWETQPIIQPSVPLINTQWAPTAFPSVLGVEDPCKNKLHMVSGVIEFRGCWGKGLKLVIP